MDSPRVPPDRAPAQATGRRVEGMMERKLVANPEIVFQEEVDGALLFNPRNGEIKLVNPTGALLFRLLDGTRSKGELAERLMREYDVESRDEAEADVDAFLCEMERMGLVGALT
ncbi:MAG: HPr-rel-A system PqqD family peptide chaperone [Chitinivibrionales bacterium]|nr:HPr-rel-A system PqqD family peptide chaperone [Chitinivibrionales bacterium]